MTGDPNRTTGDDTATVEIGYADAVAELDAILRELDDTDVDVDRLADRVQRAAALIAACRARISGARLRIDAVIADLDGPADASGPEDGSDRDVTLGTAGGDATA